VSALLDLLKSETGNTKAVAARRKALAWARVSTDMQEERGLSLPEQLKQIQEYAVKMDIEIVEEFHEAASAYKTRAKRPEFDRMLARARDDSDISVILVHDLSRFSRDSINAQTLIRDLRRAGVEVLSVSDPVIDRESVAGVYMEHILLAKNEAYSREVAFHTKKGCKANVQTRDPETGWCYKNGGQPLWGYRSETLQRGEERRGRPIYKSIWVPDDTIVSGRPVFEWAQECLRMAAGGASLDKLRDFCNAHNIPAPRSQFWGSTTWHSILELNCLLQYAGHGVWNVRGKHQRRNPPSEWVIVENAHEPLITEEEAAAVVATRKRLKRGCFHRAESRSRTSPYLLSGGLFKCQRCGANMVGQRRPQGYTYYLCGSVPARKGAGCGAAVYVPKEQIENSVIDGLEQVVGLWSEPNSLTAKVNERLREMWRQHHGVDPAAPRKLAEIEGRIARIRREIEDGTPDLEWARARLRELLAEQARLAESTSVTGSAPELDMATVNDYCRNTRRLLSHGSPEERKALIRQWVGDMKLAPEALEVEITYRVPELFNNQLGAGACSVAICNHLALSLVRLYRLGRNGRHLKVGTPSRVM